MHAEAGDAAIPQDNAYAQMDHRELLYKFCNTEGDPVIGQTLMYRVLTYAGIEDVPSSIGSDEAPMQEGAVPRSLRDYLSYATSHHPEHLEAILDFIDRFLETPRDEPEYLTLCGVVRRWIGLDKS